MVVVAVIWPTTAQAAPVSAALLADLHWLVAAQIPYNPYTAGTEVPLEPELRAQLKVKLQPLRAQLQSGPDSARQLKAWPDPDDALARLIRDPATPSRKSVGMEQKRCRDEFS